MVQKTVFQIHCFKSSCKYLLGMHIHTEMTWEDLRAASVSLQEDTRCTSTTLTAGLEGYFTCFLFLVKGHAAQNDVRDSDVQETILKVPWFCRLTI